MTVGSQTILKLHLHNVARAVHKLINWNKPGFKPMISKTNHY